MATTYKATKPYSRYGWTPAENDYLRAHATTKFAHQIAADLGRSVSGVKTQAMRLGVSLYRPGKFNGGTRGETQAATMSPSPRDLEWAAGFLEGEGHFRWAGTTQRVAATQISTREPLERLLAMFGGTIGEKKNDKARARGGKAKDGWFWGVCGTRARGVIMTLYPLMSKRRQAQMLRALRENAA